MVVDIRSFLFSWAAPILAISWEVVFAAFPAACWICIQKVYRFLYLYNIRSRLHTYFERYVLMCLFVNSSSSVFSVASCRLCKSSHACVRIMTWFSFLRASSGSRAVIIAAMSPRSQLGKIRLACRVLV